MKEKDGAKIKKKKTKTAWNDQMPPADHQYEKTRKTKEQTNKLRFEKSLISFEVVFRSSMFYVSILSRLSSLVVYSR